MSDYGEEPYNSHLENILKTRKKMSLYSRIGKA